MKICSCYNLYAVPSLPFCFLVNYCMLASWSVFTFPSQTLSIMLHEIINIMVKHDIVTSNWVIA